MLIGACQKPNWFTFLAVPTSQNIARYGRVGMTNMRRIIYIVNRRR
jgi:hypothetical protein